MDYARKIGKPKGITKWEPPVQRLASVHDNLMFTRERFSEDARLVNWRKWLANRSKQYKHIESSTGRHQNDQLLNSCEKIRPLIETRNVMDYATVPAPVVPDKFRGGPEFWRTPEALPNRDPCLPDITITPTKKDLNLLPELTYVDLPELIEKEKNLVGLKSKEPLWERSEYLLKRKNELSKEIRLIVPKQPETRHLVIEGHGPRRKKKEPRVPPITISDTEEDNNCDQPVSRDQAVILRIQDRDITWHRSAFEDGPTDPITWNLSFASQVDRRQEKELTLENRGNRVIVYEWRDAAYRPDAIPLKRRISSFFFNKTKETIPPGQIVKLKVWYLPRAPGVSSELWRLKTDPELCPSPLIIRLSGCAETMDIQALENNPVMIVDGYLDQCVRDATIRETINEIIEDMRCVEHPGPSYGSLFLESEVFAIKNPVCYYHPSLVAEFHKIHQNATNQSEQRWNLCLEDLRETLLRIKEPERRHATLTRFSDIYKECLKPALLASVEYGKHETVHNLLCSFLNRFEVESEYAWRACFEKDVNETVVAVSETSMRAINGSQGFARNGNSRVNRERRSNSPTESVRIHDNIRNSGVVDDGPYGEIFFIRIHELLRVIVERVCAAIDSFNNLNERDK
ncbi:MYCBP-associated protein-like [Hylaeus volcanicus]|uniref:MYCBP-associated protein-like n=1 Tax=Hylaeus volcanicus TaxID=313075 RepID=UPI0023B87FB1|nr:MYCBP-associated protein-like [Hylaeus volcanicus]